MIERLGNCPSHIAEHLLILYETLILFYMLREFQVHPSLLQGINKHKRNAISPVTSLEKDVRNINYFAAPVPGSPDD